MPAEAILVVKPLVTHIDDARAARVGSDALTVHEPIRAAEQRQHAADVLLDTSPFDRS